MHNVDFVTWGLQAGKACVICSRTDGHEGCFFGVINVKL